MVKETIQSKFAAIHDYASNPLGEMRVTDSFPIGNKYVRQGDVYLTRLASFDATKYKVTQNRQLAPGNSPGSRHTVSDAVTVCEPTNKEEIVTTKSGYRVMGVVVEAKERWTVMHPDHADMSLPEGIYQISYQCDPSTLRRVLD